jgi:hypothetical protein
MLVAAALVVAAVTAVASTGHAVCKNDVRRFPVTILSSSNQATVSWQVRSSGAARLRLYRVQASGDEVLVNEVITQDGVASFEFVDKNRPPGNAVYQLRVAGVDGSEANLGSASCVESKFAPSDVSPTAGSFQPAWTRGTIGLPDPGSSSLGGRFAAFQPGFIPAPEPPVPR